MGSPKLAPDSLLTVDEQERLYRESMGADRAERQVKARRLERGQCVCEPSKVRKRWSGEDTPRLRTVHDRACPKWAPWMSS